MFRLRVVVITILFIFRLRFPKGKSIADVIRKTYGDHVVKSMRKLEKLDYKRRKVELDISYLETCRDNDIIPKMCSFKTTNTALRKSGTYKNCQKQILWEEIRIKKEKLKVLIKDYEKVDKDFFEILCYVDYVHITQLQNTGNKSIILKLFKIRN